MYNAREGDEKWFQNFSRKIGGEKQLCRSRIYGRITLKCILKRSVTVVLEEGESVVVFNK